MLNFCVALTCKMFGAMNICTGWRHNLTKEMPEKVKELYTDLEKWRKDVGAQEIALNPAYKH